MNRPHHSLNSTLNLNYSDQWLDTKRIMKITNIIVSSNLGNNDSSASEKYYDAYLGVFVHYFILQCIFKTRLFNDK